MSLQALIFDVGGVVIPHDNEMVVQRLAGRSTAPNAIDRLRAAHGDERHGTGELSCPALHAMLTDEIGYAGSWEDFVDDWSCHLGLDPDMLDLVEQLAVTNRVLLFSNINQLHWQRVLELTDGRLGAFEAYLSHEIGAVKPHVHAFRLVAERAGLDPGRCLFIDDRADNVEGARMAGFQAEVFTGQSELETLLRSHGVAWPQTLQMERQA